MNETRGLGEAERYLGEPSFPEFGGNSIFIEFIVILLLIIHCFISLQILWKHKINDCNVAITLIIFYEYEIDITNIFTEILLYI